MRIFRRKQQLEEAVQGRGVDVIRYGADRDLTAKGVVEARAAIGVAALLSERWIRQAASDPHRRTTPIRLARKVIKPLLVNGPTADVAADRASESSSYWLARGSRVHENQAYMHATVSGWPRLARVPGLGRLVRLDVAEAYVQPSETRQYRFRLIDAMVGRALSEVPYARLRLRTPVDSTLSYWAESRGLNLVSGSQRESTDLLTDRPVSTVVWDSPSEQVLEALEAFRGFNALAAEEAATPGVTRLADWHPQAQE